MNENEYLEIIKYWRGIRRVLVEADKADRGVMKAADDLYACLIESLRDEIWTKYREKYEI